MNPTAKRRSDLTSDHRPARPADRSGPALAIISASGAAEAQPARPTAPDKTEPSPQDRAKETLRLILAQLDDDKAEEVVTIDLCGKTDIADAMVVASGRSARHVGAMADKIVKKLKEHGLGRPRMEGAPACDWVLIDAEDVIVHLFRPEVRQFYNLERIWSETARTPVRPDA